MDATMKGIAKVPKTLASGDRVTYHYCFRGGPMFWKGAAEDGEHTPGYAEAWRARMGYDKQPEPIKLRDTLGDLIDAWTASREWAEKAPRTQADYRRGLKDIREKFGAVQGAKLINDPALGDMVLTWIEHRRWSGKEADARLDPFKFLCSWLADRKRAMFPHNHLRGIKKFYRQTPRAEIIWSDEEVAKFVGAARAPLARAVILARQTGLRAGDLVRAGRRHLKERSDGGLAIILTTNKGRKKGRIANVPLTTAARAVVDATPLDQGTFLVSARNEPWCERHLSKEVKLHAQEIGLRSELRFNDLRGSKVTELIWRDRVSVAELALHMGWSLETAAKMAGIYSSLNPDALSRAPEVVAFPARPASAS